MLREEIALAGPAPTRPPHRTKSPLSEVLWKMVKRSKSMFPHRSSGNTRLRLNVAAYKGSPGRLAGDAPPEAVILRDLPSAGTFGYGEDEIAHRTPEMPPLRAI